MVHEHWGGDLFDERLVSDISLSDICVGIPVCLVSIDGCQIFLYLTYVSGFLSVW